MKLPTKEEREAVANVLISDARNRRQDARITEKERPELAQVECMAAAKEEHIAAFLRSDTLDRMAEAFRAADMVDHYWGESRMKEMATALGEYRAARAKPED